MMGVPILIFKVNIHGLARLSKSKFKCAPSYELCTNTKDLCKFCRTSKLIGDPEDILINFNSQAYTHSLVCSV